MKKYGIILFVIILAIIFSGCSLIPAAKESSPTSSISESIWKSVDGGKTWQVLATVKGRARVSDVNVLSLAIDPQNSQIIWVGLLQGGLMKTQDGGETWEFSEIFSSEKVYGLAIDPTNSQVIYASAVFEDRGKIFKSEDGGASWKEIYTTASTGPLVVAMTLDEKNPRVIYASTSDNQTIKTENGGDSWRNIFVSDSPVIKIALDSSDNNLVYLINNGGEIHRSKNAGVVFEKLSLELPDDFWGESFSVVETDPNMGGWIYAAGVGGIIRSKDSGEKWEKVIVLQDPQSAPIDAMAISPINAREIVYAAGQATFKSQDGGVNWTPAQFNLAKFASVMQYDQRDGNVVYAGFRKK